MIQVLLALRFKYKTVVTINWIDPIMQLSMLSWQEEAGHRGRICHNIMSLEWGI